MYCEAARKPRTGSGMARRVARLALLLLGVSLTATATKSGGKPQEDKDKQNEAESPCEVKTVTVSTLPVLRENEFSFTGAGSGSMAGGESRLLLFVRTDVPGQISVLDDLDNTALPYFTLGSSADQQVWWRNGSSPLCGSGFASARLTHSEPLFVFAVIAEPCEGVYSAVEWAAPQMSEISATGLMSGSAGARSSLGPWVGPGRVESSGPVHILWVRVELPSQTATPKAGFNLPGATRTVPQSVVFVLGRQPSSSPEADRDRGMWETMVLCSTALGTHHGEALFQYQESMIHLFPMNLLPPQCLKFLYSPGQKYHILPL
ncbi:hypothetical protein P4O66_002791 [Electrophorus voltai]|uniref:Reelin domain-containing protein n=1 Tax=Electrophorus voltai TaxID=2609070 RepID=A0AAD8YX20_9TELE|nr:hypothetical protein P4O66_002791 [Electrophorus voltai]